MSDHAQPLTSAQAEVAHAPPDSRRLVLAGPGTGKTHTLIHRLSYLIDDCELGAGSEVLVLSFSRAAVAEIRVRVGRLSGSAGWVDAVTFDAFATRLLQEFDHGGTWVDKGYDDRVKAATQCLRDGIERSALEDVQHILVDEIQDLVGVRLELVKTLLQATECGFTLLGDPAQAIYDWQVDTKKQTAARLHEWVRSALPTRLEETVLEKNHRQSTDDARAAVALGAKLRAAPPDEQGAYKALTALVQTIQHVPLPLAAIGLKRTKDRVAVLCRNNGDAMVVSHKLGESGVPHRLQPVARERPTAAWAALLAREGKLNTSRQDFETWFAESEAD